MQTNTPNNADEPAFPAYDSAHPGLTARQYAAIHLRVPMADEPWLNAMITEARRWDAAQAVAAAAMTQANGLGTLTIEQQTEQLEGLAEICDRTADALTRKMKGGAQ